MNFDWFTGFLNFIQIDLVTVAGVSLSYLDIFVGGMFFSLIGSLVIGILQRR